MAEAAVTFLLTQVTEVLKEYHNLIAGAESEFNQLSNDLSSLKAFLKEMAKKKKKDDLLRVLERRIRTVVYEVEDTMDSCMTKVIESKASHSLVSAILPTRSFSLAREVKSMIEEKVQPLFNDASKFADMKKLADGSGGVELPRTTLTRVEPIARNRIVGFKDQEDVIVELLKKQTESLDVISIVGVPGQGKTTLAWMVHDNQSIELHFSIRIWRASPLVDEALEDWERVSKNVSDALQKDPKNRITNVVDLSYQRLPENLRDCFVYLGVFPEDYEISVKILCGLWIAEGFIQRKDDTKTLEETAQDNLADLITRNLLKGNSLASYAAGSCSIGSHAVVCLLFIQIIALSFSSR
ncbi:hypothetical protein C2S51_027780 [Perilla frutescens var. frutescens]|nr:hypothetical protein C2S51_027780 [Perilla frutescens var. frutescens]